jgi:glycosyltransferase involved in cell wall biosynthesis
VKLIIQIPCHNEAATLAETIRHLPRSIPGIDRIELLVIDDGSGDRTVDVARRCGADHVVRLTNRRGLAHAFAVGVRAAIRLGANILVNTDGDNQYDGRDVATLVRPILDGEADMVVGSRPIEAIEHFSPLKRRLQRVGSAVVRWLSGTTVQDTTSGFRAFSREALLQLNVFTNFSYTLETIVQAGSKRLAIASVPVRTNRKLRESRLFRSIPAYLCQSIQTLARVVALYKPLPVFGGAGMLCGLAALVICLQYVWAVYVNRVPDSTIQARIILATILFSLAGMLGAVGLLADSLAANRRLQEEILYRLRRADLPATAQRKPKRRPFSSAAK